MVSHSKKRLRRGYDVGAQTCSLYEYFWVEIAEMFFLEGISEKVTLTQRKLWAEEGLLTMWAYHCLHTACWHKGLGIGWMMDIPNMPPPHQCLLDVVDIMIHNGSCKTYHE